MITGKLRKQDHSFSEFPDSPSKLSEVHKYVFVTAILQRHTPHHTKAASLYINTYPPAHHTFSYKHVNNLDLYKILVE